MIIGLWHLGSGIGDQLFSYLATRVTAERLGVDFGMIGKFKGDDFLILDKGKQIDLPSIIENSTGKITVQSDFALFESSLICFNPEFNFIKDNTIIDGTNLQDERYWDLGKVNKWIGIKANFFDLDEDVCVINFRGGEYQSNPELFLPFEYWAEAIGRMKMTYEYFDSDNVPIKFEVHTDDPIKAKEFFPKFPIFTGIELNWRAVRFSSHLILSNSAFGVIPALLNQNAREVVAPKFWAGRNVGEWRRPQNYYKKFTYI